MARALPYCFYAVPTEELALTEENRRKVTVLSVKSPKRQQKEAVTTLRSISKAANLQKLLLRPIDIQETREIRIVFEPIIGPMRSTIVGNSSRSGNWVDSEAIPAMSFLCLSLWQLHKAGFVHGSVSIDSIYLTTEGLYKLGHFLLCRHQATTGDLGLCEDVRMLGCAFLGYLTGNADVEVCTAGKQGELLGNIDNRLKEVVGGMTNDQIGLRITAETAFVMLYSILGRPKVQPVPLAMVSNPAFPVSPPPQSVPRPLEVSLSSDLNFTVCFAELQALINTREVVSDELIVAVLENVSRARRDYGKEFQIMKKTDLVVKCVLCRENRQKKFAVNPHKGHFWCFSCVKTMVVARREKVVKCTACSAQVDLSTLQSLPTELVALVRSLE